MTIPPVYSWQALDLVTADMLNTYLRDPQVWLLGMPAYSGVTDATAQTIVTHTYVKILMNIDRHARSMTHATNDSKVYPTEPGWYRASGFIRFAHTTTGTTAQRGAYLLKNNSDWILGSAHLGTAAGATGAFFVNTNGFVYMNGTTDYIELVGFQTTGNNTDVKTYGAADYTGLTLIWQGRDQT